MSKISDIAKFVYKANKLLDQQKVPHNDRYLRFANKDGDVIEMRLNMSDYVNVYELHQIREWWKKLTKPRLFNVPRIRFCNIWYEFLYVVGLSKYGH